MEVSTRPDGIFDEENRRPTNVCWIIPFIIAIITFIVFGVLATLTAGPGGIAVRLDPDNNFGSNCGFDSDVLDKTVRISIDDRKCGADPRLNYTCNHHHICIEACPKGNFDAETCNPITFNKLKEGLVCKSERFRSNINNCNQLKDATKNNECVAWYENTFEFFRTCMSRESDHKDSDDVSSSAIDLDIAQVALSLLPSFLYAIVIAGVVSLLFALTLKWSAAFVFWGFVCLVFLVLVGLMITVVVIGLNSESQKDKALAIFVPVGIISIAMLIFIVCVYCFRHKIRCGIEIVKESSNAVCASFGSIFFPILPFLIRSVVLLATLYIVVMASTMRVNQYRVDGLGASNGDCSCKSSLYSTGDVCVPETFNTDCRSSNGEICTSAGCKLFSQEESDLSVPYMAATLMLSVWIVAFIQANSKMILAHVYGNWYWNWNREFIPTGAVGTALGKILGNHTGTAALGAFVIMICRTLKSLISRRDGSSVNGIGAMVARVFLELFRACAQLLLELVEYVSDQAFVICAIMGLGFWDSVKVVSKIMVKDIPLVVATEYVGDIILFVCKFVSALLSAGLFYVTSPYKGEELYITILTTILIFLFAYDLAAVLLTAYDVAIDTLLICTLQDYMHSGAEKAYFRSDTLNALLLKKDEHV